MSEDFISPKVLEGVGTVASALGQFKSGRAAEGYSAAQAGSIRRHGAAVKAINLQEAKREIALSQRRSLEERRKMRLVASRALAVAAAGGGAMDPTVMKIISDIDAEGIYRASVAMYEGEARASRLRLEGEYADYSAAERAALTEFEGEQKASQFYTRGATTLFKGTTSWLGRYGTNKIKFEQMKPQKATYG